MAPDAGSRTAELLERLRSSGVPTAGERCELCGAPVGDPHPHLADIEARAIVCACRPCGVLFSPEGAGGRRFKRIPNRYAALTALDRRPHVWENLELPVGMAFLFRNSVVGRSVAFYPGPAGATESLLAVDAWDTLVASDPLLQTLADDVEAVLVRRHPERIEAYIVPIDACYELIGELRQSWRGFDGGDEARQRVDAFFASLSARTQARP